MLALSYQARGGLRVEDRPTPEPGPGQALLRVGACGICGTDLRIAAGQHRAYEGADGRIPGHEVAGTVVQVGAGVDAVREGDMVFVAPNIGCGTCRACRSGRLNLCERPQAIGITRDGGLAEYLLLDEDMLAGGNVLVVPRRLDAATIALAEPLACVLRGSEACRIEAGNVVLIFGAGPIGLMHVMLAKQRAPDAVIVAEPALERRRRAERLGAHRTVDPAADELADVVREVSGGTGADVVITAAPVGRAQAEALEVAASGGRINFFGGLARDASRVELDTNLIHYKELVVTGTTANTTDDCRRAVELVTSGAIDTAELIGARMPLASGDDALAAARSGDVIKVVIEP